MEKTEEKVCAVCGKNPGPDPRNKILWYGFLDKDTGQYVCLRKRCREKYYKQKSKTEHAGKYSEFPVYA